MATVVEKIVSHYHKAMEAGDPRTTNWPLMSTPWSTLGLISLYIATVTISPRVMKNREAFNLKWLLLVYNFVLVILSLYMLCEVKKSFIQSIAIKFLLTVLSIPGFRFLCDGVAPGTDPILLRYASVNWLFFVSKLLEFLETIFFILRKKNNQVSFLHVYHHISVCSLWWTVVKWNPGGVTYFGASFNCFVHLVMYVYYLVSALGPQYRKYLWWKKYLTSLQLFQFTTVNLFIAHAMTIQECTFPHWVFKLFFAYNFSLMALFANFFISEYINQARAKKEQKSN